MNETICEARGAASEETQLRIGPVTSMAERAAKEMVEARNAIGAEWRVAGEQSLNFRGECRAYFFVGVEREDPNWPAISSVASVEPESRMIISCAQRTLSSVRGRFSASLSAIRTTEREWDIVARIHQVHEDRFSSASSKAC